MFRLDTLDIVYLSYLTNYNINMIYSCMANFADRESILIECMKKMKLTDKEMMTIYEEAYSAIQKLRYYKIKPISIFDDDYPKTLKLINDPPPVLYVKGTLKDMNNAAVIGSRLISKYAERNTKNVIHWLDQENYSIVSGLAEGIDTIAHTLAVENSIYTIAVLPNSLDHIYPKSNYGLASDILNLGGCLISESLFNINRGKKSFVQRNRIQAALSDIVVPIEMGTNSGTMHTLNFAKKYGKKILLPRILPEYSKVKQYSGIREVISKPHNNIYLYEDELSFKKSLTSNRFDKQLNIKL